jgi:hypothetical protein
MEPLSNQQFSHDAVKFVYQQSDVPVVPSQLPKKEFKINTPDKSKKTKKDQDKNKEQDKA